MGAVLPLDTVHVYQAEEGFIDQRGGLESVFSALAPHVSPGDLFEFLV